MILRISRCKSRHIISSCRVEGLGLYDVAVIGAGPAGSQVAYRLAKMGYGVMVLEQKEKVWQNVCCSGIIGRECAASFRVDKSVVFRQVNSAWLFSPSGNSIRLWRPETQAYIINRAAFNVFMANRAQAQGAEYVLGSTVRDIEVDEDGVRVSALHGGDELTYVARVAVVAAGFGSGLVERLGMRRVGDIVMGAQAEVETVGIDEVEVYFGSDIAPGFFAWVVPTLPNRALVGLLSRRSPGQYLRKLMSSLRAQGRIASSQADINHGGIPLKPLPRTYGERLVVVGDTAGLVKPTTGGGIYYGLLSADMAVDTLHRALKANNLSARSLASFEREWKRRLGRELKVGYWGRKLYERLSDRQIDRAFDIIKSDGINESLLEEKDLSFDWHGGVVLRLMGYRAVSKVLNVVKAPFHLTSA